MKSIVQVVQNLLKPYIDSNIQTLTNEETKTSTLRAYFDSLIWNSLANTNASSNGVASRAYKVGEKVYVNFGTSYDDNNLGWSFVEVTSAIAQGGTFVKNSNCKVVTDMLSHVGQKYEATKVSPAPTLTNGGVSTTIATFDLPKGRYILFVSGISPVVPSDNTLKQQATSIEVLTNTGSVSKTNIQQTLTYKFNVSGFVDVQSNSATLSVNVINWENISPTAGGYYSASAIRIL